MRRVLRPAVMVASPVQPQIEEARPGCSGNWKAGAGWRRSRDPRPTRPNPAAPEQRKAPPSDRALVATSCCATQSQKGRGTRLPALPEARAHPEPAAVVAWMELMRRRLAVSFRAWSFC